MKFETKVNSVSNFDIIYYMIAHIFGKVDEKFGNSLIVDVNGVGYEVMVPTPDFEGVKLNEMRKFYTYHAVREQSEELYGFSSLLAKKLFEMLISVQGIGPKAGIAILSLAEAEDVRNAIANSDTAFIAKASGVGKKSAERVIVDLSDKVGAPSKYGATEVKFGVSPAPVEKDDALDALIALGFNLKEAMEALKDVDLNLSVEERVKLALKNK